MCPEITRSYPSLLRGNVVAEARKWLGTPFRHQGRNAQGIDCAGLVIVTARGMGVVAPEFDENNYPRRSPHSLAFLKYFLNHDALEKKSNADMAPGDIVITKEPHYACHCSIVGEKNGALTLIHAYAPHGKVLEDYFTAGGYAARQVATFGFKGIV